MTQQFLSAAYSRRPAPKQYDPSFLNVELARIARSMPSYVIRSVTANTTLQVNDGMIVGNANGGAFTITLPDPSKGSGQPVTIKKTDSSVNKITIGGTVDGVANRTLDLPNDSIILQSDGASWFRPTLTASGAGSSFTSITVTASTSSTNLITYPNTYSDASWTLNSVVITSAIEDSPVGTPTAALLTGGATDANILHAIPWTTTSSKEVAIYIKQGTLSQHELTVYNNTGASFLGIMNIQWTAGVPTPSSTSGTWTNLTAAAYPGGWYRVSGTLAGVVHTNSYSMLFYTHHRGAGSAGTVYVWGASAYETATGTAATAVTVTGASFFYGPVTVSGVLTLSSAPVLSALSASLPVVTNASKALASATVTGTGTTIVMSVSPTITGTANIAGITYTTALGSLTNYATPAAFTQTLSSQFASTVSGATLMGYGTTGDVTLKSRAGSDALYVVANSVNVRAKGSLTSDAATGGVGYATGAGGTVTQGAGSGKATAFTLSKVCGQITTDAANLGVDTTVSATWTNTAIAATDTVAISHVSGGTVGAYSFNVQPGAGTATLNITNRSAGALAEALVLNFVVIKGVTA